MKRTTQPQQFIYSHVDCSQIGLLYQRLLPLFIPSLFACCWHTWNRPTWQPIADIVRFAVCFMQNIQRKYVNMLALWNKLVAKIDVRPNIYSDVNFWIIRYLLMHISCIRWNDADCDKVKNQFHIVAAAICSQAIHSINIFTFFSIYPYSFFSLCLHFLLSAWKRFCVPWLDVYFLRWS